MTPSFVLSRVPPCDVPLGDRAVLAARGGWVEKECASVVPLPAALLGCHFEHPAGFCTARRGEIVRVGVRK